MVEEETWGVDARHESAEQEHVDHSRRDWPLRVLKKWMDYGI